MKLLVDIYCAVYEINILCLRLAFNEKYWANIRCHAKNFMYRITFHRLKQTCKQTRKLAGQLDCTRLSADGAIRKIKQGANSTQKWNPSETALNVAFSVFISISLFFCLRSWPLTIELSFIVSLYYMTERQLTKPKSSDNLKCL